MHFECHVDLGQGQLYDAIDCCFMDHQEGVDEPPVPANVELLLDAMEAVNVKGALIVQSSTHGFDHSYVTHALKSYPGKFVGCLLANPAEVRYSKLLNTLVWFCIHHLSFNNIVSAFLLGCKVLI